MIAYQTADADQEWRDDQAARRDYILDRAKDMPNRCWQEWCDDYNVSLGICMLGEEFPRCETGRTIRNNAGL